MSTEKPFAFSLAHSEADGARIKSAKRHSQSGSLIQGAHDKFVFAAESADDQQRWVRALRENALISARFHSAPPPAA